jgi:hypothetical protein
MSFPLSVLRRRWRLAIVALLVITTIGFTAVWTNALGAGERFHRLVARIELALDPPPRRPTVSTIVVTPRPSPVASAVQASGAPLARHEPIDGPPLTLASATPVVEAPPTLPPPTLPPPTPPPARTPVDVSLVADPNAVFASQITNEWCAPAGTQMALTVMGLGNPSEAFQNELESRIDEWESWEDSHDGGWGPGAIAQALAAYGAPGYQIRAYDVQQDALRDAAVALSYTGRPVLIMAWWGAHTWVMTGYQADADPTIFPDATITGTYILDPWYPRVSTIWGASDPPGTFQDAAEMQRNFIPWSRPEGLYPDRDGKFVLVIPT